MRTQMATGIDVRADQGVTAGVCKTVGSAEVDPGSATEASQVSALQPAGAAAAGASPALALHACAAHRLASAW